MDAMHRELGREAKLAAIMATTTTPVTSLVRIVAKDCPASGGGSAKLKTL